MIDRNSPPKRWIWLTELIQQHGWTTGVEVGVKEGENLFYLLDHNPGLTMHAVDPWVVQPGAHETYEWWDLKGMAQEVTERAAGYGGRCIVHRCYSLEAAAVVPDVDFVFIDAQHTEDALRADIAAWRGKCTFLAGHDMSEDFPGIERAVMSCFPPERVILGPNTCWAVWTDRVG